MVIVFHILSYDLKIVSIFVIKIRCKDPFRRDIEDWIEEPFEQMIERFEESVPPEFEGLVREEKTPSGIVRRYGPFVYGFSYTAEPGKMPIFQEFGNVRPSSRASCLVRGVNHS